MDLDDIKKELLTLRRRRGVIKGSLTRIRNFIAEFNPRDKPISLLEFRQDELPQINKKFDEVQSQIDLISEDVDKENEERNAFELEYFSVRSQIHEIVNAEKSLNSSMAHNQSMGMTGMHRAKLAPISIPTFSGNIQEWESFFDCFSAMVHRDDSYSLSQKFYYLRSSLGGQALDMIKSIPMTDANYEVALERLKQRFDNKSLVIQSHIRALIDSPRVEAASSSELLSLHSHVCSHISALRAIGQPVDHWDAWLVTIITSCLDVATAQDWQLSCINTDLPKYEAIEKFIASRCTALETSEAWHPATGGAKCPASKKLLANLNTKKSLIATETRARGPCVYCSGTHRLYQCDKFKNLDVKERLVVVRRAHLCFNCLSGFHSADSCKSKYTCSKCNRKHDSLLHFKNTSEEKRQTNAEEGASLVATSPSQEPISLTVCQEYSHAFLATAVVLVKDNQGVYRECRAILDSGSQVNFISKRLANLLQLPSKKTMLPINGIGANKIQSSASLELQVKSRVKEFNVNISCYTLPVIINDLPSVAVPASGWMIPGQCSSQLADPGFCKSGSIDLLVGCGIFFELMEADRVSLDIGGLVLQNTKFGWIVTGEISKICLLSIGQTIEEDWQVIRNADNMNFGQSSKANLRVEEEQLTLQHFNKNTVRDQDGRFVVRLPINQLLNELGSSYGVATSRFLSIERKLQRDNGLREEYIKFMSEYISLGHIQEIKSNWLNSEHLWYLPHHAVIKNTSLTTKVRVVFDASARGSNGLSLNDVLMCGPTVQGDVFSILLRFRKYQYVLTADVEKMFRQVKVDKRDWDLQRILWRANPSDPLLAYHLTTVTYGTTPASFLATQCLVALSKENQKEHSKAAQAIRNDFYMDDLITGADTEEECCELQTEINTVMNTARFPLRKWLSNSSVVLKHVGKRLEDPLYTLELNEGEAIRSLGLEWQPSNDQFQFTITEINFRTKFTKRTLLSDLNRIFDPLGFVSPVLLKGKIFLQQIWAMQMDWDSPLPIDLRNRWISFYGDLKQLKSVTVVRKASPRVSQVMQIHGFSDASQEAYGACLYLRSKDHEGNWHSRLLCSKTRVAPLKGSTIPRLELCGALLLAELASKVADSWKLNMETFWLWTDSTIVLGWLHSQRSRLKTYVSNRVNQILDLTHVTQWHHVRSEDNPADLASRGLSTSELTNATIWWNGPQWLKKEDIEWTRCSVPVNEDELPERRKIQLALVVAEQGVDMVNIKSDWNQLVRSIAWLLLFVDYLRNKKVIEVSGYLTAAQLKRAELILLRRVQTESFSKEISALENGKEVPRGSRLKGLYPFMRDGVLLVGGRIQNADVSECQKHPIVLPATHKLTRLIFEKYHREMLHCGPQALLAELRRRYWPLNGRLTARAVVRKCVKCVRAQPRFEEPLMAPLPKHRVQIARPFATTGVDFAGPFTIRSGIRRVVGKKSWIAVFVCFTTRAVHMEVVEDMTSTAFLACLKRFMSRRGRCLTIYSDNGTNFVGAQRELSSFVSKGEPAMAQEGIEWRFNPPSSPHFGGLWEAAVKNAKYHLRRVMGDTKLTLAELNYSL